MNADQQVDWGRCVLQLLDRHEVGLTDAIGSSATVDNAATVAPTIEHISTALGRTLAKHVSHWIQSHLPRSLQFQRRVALKPVHKGTNTG